MAEEEYEVKGLHDELLEEHAEKDTLAQKIALLTAVLATIGAVFSYQSGANQNRAMMLKNESILMQAQASDQWAFYQAKSTKEHIDAVAATLTPNPVQQARFQSEAQHEESDKKLIKQKAEELETRSREIGQEAENALKPHERLASGMTLIQIAVALASITALTRKRWLIWGSLAAAVAGISIALTGLI